MNNICLISGPKKITNGGYIIAYERPDYSMKKENCVYTYYNLPENRWSANITEGTVIDNLYNSLFLQELITELFLAQRVKLY